MEKTDGSIYDFKVEDIDGKTIDFNIYKGKKLLIVNTASKCGYTSQYAELEQLHQRYGHAVEVLGFPANNFLWQEPGSNEQIATFCIANYGITFKMFSKISVKGKDRHPLYQWLLSKTGKAPTWNFCKYLVSSDGRELKFFAPDVRPLDPALIKDISN